MDHASWFGTQDKAKDFASKIRAEGGEGKVLTKHSNFFKVIIKYMEKR